MKVLTLDVWNTLIMPNSEYGQIRNKRIANHMISKGLASISDEPSLGEWVKMAYKKMKNLADQEALDGVCLNTKETYDRLAKYLTVHNNDMHSQMSDSLMTIVQSTFKEYPPYIYPSLQKALFTAHNNGWHIATASNNNFISAKTMIDTVLSQLEVGFTFAFNLHSTELCAAKPSHVFGQHYLSNLNRLGCTLDNVHHIGDNPICDDFTKYGVRNTHIINNPQEAIKKILEIL